MVCAQGTVGQVRLGANRRGLVPVAVDDGEAEMSVQRRCPENGKVGDGRRSTPLLIT